MQCSDTPARLLLSSGPTTDKVFQQQFFRGRYSCTDAQARGAAVPTPSRVYKCKQSKPLEFAPRIGCPSLAWINRFPPEHVRNWQAWRIQDHQNATICSNNFGHSLTRLEENRTPQYLQLRQLRQQLQPRLLWHQRLSHSKSPFLVLELVAWALPLASSNAACLSRSTRLLLNSPRLGPGSALDPIHLLPLTSSTHASAANTNEPRYATL